MVNPLGEAQIHLPDFPSLLPAKAHPDTGWLAETSNQWARTRLRACVRTDAELEDFIEGGIARLVCHMLPQAPRTVVLATCDLFQYLVLLDDAFSDKGLLGASEHAARHVAGRVMTALTGWGGGPDLATGAVHDAASRLRPALSAGQWERLAAGVADYLDGCVIEVATRADDGLADFEAYTRHRRVTVGMKWILVLAELTPGQQLNPAIPGHALGELHNIALDHLWMVNDLFSFLKEYHGREFTSAIPVLRRSADCSPQDAVNWILGQVAGRERAFADLRDTLLAGPLASEPGLRAYLDNIGYVMSSALHWSWDTSRYHVPGVLDPRKPA
jgi:hypothetical protein